MSSGNDLFPGPGGGMNGLTPWGDPEAYASAAASTAMKPIIGPYLKSVAQGQGIVDALQRYYVPPEPYDPNKPLGAYINPRSMEVAQDLALSLGPGVIGGARAATANIGTLREAENMESLGFHRDDIHAATGWGRGEEGRWKNTISDADAELNLDKLEKIEQPHPSGQGTETLYKIPEGQNLKLGDIFKHDKLYDAYPAMKDIDVSPLKGEQFDGLHNPAENWMSFSPGRAEDLKSTIIHEAQHNIQWREGFARGGTYEEFLPPNFAGSFKNAIDLRGALEQQIEAAGHDPGQVAMAHGLYPFTQPFDAIKPQVSGLDQGLLDRYKKSMDWVAQHVDTAQEAYRRYLNLGGEVEAGVAEQALREGNWSKAPWQYDVFQRGADAMERTMPYPQNQYILFDRTGGAWNP